MHQHLAAAGPHLVPGDLAQLALVLLVEVERHEAAVCVVQAVAQVEQAIADRRQM
jgi:hypothetical protein